MEQTNRPINVRSPYARGVLTFTSGPFRLHVPERSLQRHRVSVPRGERAFDILTFLVQRAGQVVRFVAPVVPGAYDRRAVAGTVRLTLTRCGSAID